MVRKLRSAWYYQELTDAHAVADDLKRTGSADDRCRVVYYTKGWAIQRYIGGPYWMGYWG